MIKSEAMFTLDRLHRYTLTRIWSQKPLVQFIGLNPSTADEVQNDPTVTRCINFAHSWGFGGMVMTNLFAFRATKPKDLWKAADPVGPDNDFWLQHISSESEIVVGAWGTLGERLDRARQVIPLLPESKIRVLGLTKNGQPKHPLYLKKSLKPLTLEEATGMKPVEEVDKFEW